MVLNTVTWFKSALYICLLDTTFISLFSSILPYNLHGIHYRNAFSKTRLLFGQLNSESIHTWWQFISATVAFTYNHMLVELLYKTGHFEFKQPYNRYSLWKLWKSKIFWYSLECKSVYICRSQFWSSLLEQTSHFSVYYTNYNSSTW